MNPQRLNISPASLKTGIPFLLWVLIAFVLRDFMPWFFWLTMLVLPCAALALEESTWIRSRTGLRLLLICAALFLVHTAWAFIRARTYDAASPGTYWLDDQQYFIEVTAIAKAWQEGEYPRLWLKGSLPYLGTLHTGYHRPLAFLFQMFGPSTLAGLMLNAISLSTVPFFTALCAKYLFDNNGPKTETKTTPWQIRVQNFGGPAMIAGALAALHPAQFYWSAYLMKDAWNAATFVAAMALLLGTIQRRSLPLAVAALMVLPYTLTVRMYAGGALLVGLLLLPVLKLPTRKVITAAIAAAVTIFLVLAYTERGNAIYSQVRDSFASLAPANATSPTDMLKQLAAGIPRLFLSPYSWLIYDKPTPLYGMYPGMWFMYIIAYPLGFAGLYAAIRRNIHLCIIPITAFALAALLFLTASYGGNASRQRYYLEYIVLIFAAYGVKHPSRWWIGAILLLEIAWMVGQVIALK